jgi:integrase
VLFYLMGFRYFNTTLMYTETAIARWWAGYAGNHPLMKGQLAPGMEKAAPVIAMEVDGRFGQADEGEDIIRGGDKQAHITIPETFALMAAAYTVNPTESERNYLLVRFIYATALRVAEVQDLKFLDLDYEECRVFVRNGKGYKDRYTLIDPETARRLKAFQGERGWGESVFDITDRTMRDVIEAAGTATGILAKYQAMEPPQTVSPHTFRHAHGNHCYESGIDLFTLKKLVGHSGLETTIDYVECGLDWQMLVYEKMHELSRHP